jgi:hypothetical protein
MDRRLARRRVPRRTVRELGAISQWTYRVPAAVLVLSLRRARWAALILLGTTLVGVGLTMFWSFSLTTHLAWLAAAVLTVVVAFSALVERRQRDCQAGRRTSVPAD